MERGRAAGRVIIAAGVTLALGSVLPATVLAAGARFSPLPVRLAAAPPRDHHAAPPPTASRDSGPRSAHGCPDDRDAVPTVAAVGRAVSGTLVTREPDGRERRRSPRSEGDPDPTRTSDPARDARPDLRVGDLACGGALFHEAHAPPARSSLAVDRSPS